MIVSALLSVIYILVGNLIRPLQFPEVPAEFFDGLMKITGFLESGKPFFNFVFPIKMSVFFNLFVAIWGLKHGYNLVMWIIKKIPLFGIS